MRSTHRLHHISREPANSRKNGPANGRDDNDIRCSPSIVVKGIAFFLVSAGALQVGYDFEENECAPLLPTVSSIATTIAAGFIAGYHGNSTEDVKTLALKGTILFVKVATYHAVAAVENYFLNDA